MTFAYARVSTFEQKTDSQLEDLQNYGYQELVTDTISGKDFVREGLNILRTKLRKDDTLVVWRLDRLGRSMINVLNFTNELKKIGVHFVSIKDGVDTNTPIGNLMIGLMATISEYEYGLLKERQKAGFAARKRKGLPTGRRKGLNQDSLNKAKLVQDLYSLNQYSITDIMKKTKVGSRATIYKYINLNLK